MESFDVLYGQCLNFKCEYHLSVKSYDLNENFNFLRELVKIYNIDPSKFVEAINRISSIIYMIYEIIWCSFIINNDILLNDDNEEIKSLFFYKNLSEFEKIIANSRDGKCAIFLASCAKITIIKKYLIYKTVENKQSYIETKEQYNNKFFDYISKAKEYEKKWFLCWLFKKTTSIWKYNIH